MRTRLSMFLSVLFGLTVLLGGTAGAQGLNLGAVAAADANAGAYRDEGLAYYWFTENGLNVTPGSDAAAVKVAITVRAYYPCTVVSCDPDAVDAAARGYDLGSSSVGNVQVDRVTLKAEGDGTIRSGPTGPSNSNGGPYTGLANTADVCVNSGAGRFYATTLFSWRNVRTNTVYQFVATSDITSASFRSC